MAEQVTAEKPVEQVATPQVTETPKPTKGELREADYTRKMQQLARDREQLNREREEIQRARGSVVNAGLRDGLVAGPSGSYPLPGEATGDSPEYMGTPMTRPEYPMGIPDEADADPDAPMTVGHAKRLEKMLAAQGQILAAQTAEKQKEAKKKWFDEQVDIVKGRYDDFNKDELDNYFASLTFAEQDYYRKTPPSIAYDSLYWRNKNENPGAAATAPNAEPEPQPEPPFAERPGAGVPAPQPQTQKAISANDEAALREAAKRMPKTQKRGK